MKLQRFYLPILLIVLVCCLTCPISFAGPNLPQLQVQVTVKWKDHQQLKKYFQAFKEIPNSLDKKIENLLITNLPKPFNQGCKEMISKWGKDTKGTASTVARALYLKNISNSYQQIIIAFTCFSSTPEYGTRFYDERLALLTIDSSSSTLTMVPHAKPCDICSNLSHLEFSDELQIGGMPAVSIGILNSNKNPCCSDSTLREDITVNYYLLETRNLKLVASVLKKKTETIHDDIRGNSTSNYTADITLEKDENANVIKIVTSFEITSDNKPTTRSIRSYSWNNKRHTFEEGE